MKGRAFIIVGIVIAIIVVAIGLLVARQPESTDVVGENQLRVATSTAVILELTQQILGDNGVATLVGGSATDPHTFEPSPGQIAELGNVDVVLYQGGGLSPWVERVRPDLEAANVAVIDVVKGIEPKINAGSESEDKHDEEGHNDDGHGHDSAYNPHIWMDPALLLQEVDAITSALVQVAGTSEGLTNNAEELKQELRTLDQEFTDELAQCVRKEFVVEHDAYAYLERAYGITTTPILGTSHADEPTASEFDELIHKIQEQKITTIFVEPETSQQYASTVAAETGATTRTLNPVEQIRDGESYFTIMRKNLRELVATCR